MLGHWWAQVPQLCRSVWRLSQVPLQQVWLAAHAWPQVPQLALLVWRSTQPPVQQVWLAEQT